jgi:hypothetical protein
MARVSDIALYKTNDCTLLALSKLKIFAALHIFVFVKEIINIAFQEKMVGDGTFS